MKALTQQQVDYYRQNGFVFPIPALSPAEIADCLAGLERLETELGSPVADAEMTRPAGLLLVASLHGEPVGCGALIFCPEGVGLVKRTWVAPAVRGLGLGRRLLHELEDRARADGVRLMHLETRDELPEAIDHAQHATEELRELAHGILPATLSHVGLRAAVRQLVSRMPLPVENRVSGERFSATIEATEA